MRIVTIPSIWPACSNLSHGRCGPIIGSTLVCTVAVPSPWIPPLPLLPRGPRHWGPSDRTKPGRHSRRSRRLAVAGLLATGPLFMPAGQAVASVPRTITFTSQGEHAFTVPAGVSTLTITAVGARGGEAGGSGAAVTGSVTVTSGATLYVNVARGGAASAAAGGGAGGGASDVATCSTSGGGCVLTGDQATDPGLIVAAGGGCGADPSGAGAAGGAGGDTGQDGVTRAVPDAAGGGGGGSATAGGPGGAACTDASGDTGDTGMAGLGGSGGDVGFGGGGGGGGWFGGGGGGSCEVSGSDSRGSAGGGGGSNRVPAGGTPRRRPTPHQ